MMDMNIELRNILKWRKYKKFEHKTLANLKS